MDPQIIYKAIASNNEYTTLQVATDLKMWDIQYMCLDKGQTQSPSELWIGIINSSWIIFSTNFRVFKAKEEYNENFPWRAFIRSLSGFLQYEVDLSLLILTELSGRSEVEWVVDMAKGYVPADELKTVKSYLQKGTPRKRDRFWRRFK